MIGDKDTPAGVPAVVVARREIVNENPVIGPVRIVGTGLLGTSIGLALSGRSVEVFLTDALPARSALAAELGAGRVAGPGDPEPSLIVVAVPPDLAAAVIATELLAHPTAVVTDVASVKSGIADDLREAKADVSRYCGSHPFAGRERGGPLAARGDLFLGRPWVLCPGIEGSAADPGSVALVEKLVSELGAISIFMDVVEHDAAAAAVSHVPQLISTLMARLLNDAPDTALALAGQGLRDVTRIAASDPDLWVQILSANALPVRSALERYRENLNHVIEILEDPTTTAARRALAEQISEGNVGVARIPGKHGTTNHFALLSVMVDDRPGELARLLVEIGEIGVNLEDLRLEHAQGRQIGVVEIQVLPDEAPGLVRELTARGWRVAA